MSDSELVFPELPFWQGIREGRGPYKTFPFSLGLDTNGLISQTTDPLIREKIIRAYAEDSYSFITSPPGASNWGNARGEAQAEFIERFAKFSTTPTILEIGAAGPYVGRKLRNNRSDINYTILDPAAKSASETGVEVIRDFFPCPEIAGRRFDVVCAFNVLEHVEDPYAMLSLMASFLSPDNGMIILTFPDSENGLINCDINIMVHEHIYYFTPASTVFMANVVGLEVAYIESRNDLIWVIFKKSAFRNQNDGLKHEDGLLLNAKDRFTKIIESKATLMCKELGEGRPIFFHGATNGLNNFLHLAGLVNNPNIVVYDGDKAKVGKFLPTCVNPVRDSADSSYGLSERIYISALSYYEPITSWAQSRHGFSRDKMIPLFP